MRQINSHKVGDCPLDIVVEDEAGPGGANHEYRLFIEGEVHFGTIKFQDGGIAERGNNGITNEALIAIVIDRLQGFQSGNFKCRENAIALTKLEEALLWLQKRTRDRMARGVEGRSVA